MIFFYFGPPGGAQTCGLKVTLIPVVTVHPPSSDGSDVVTRHVGHVLYHSRDLSPNLCSSVARSEQMA